MTLDQKIADLSSALERVETQQSQILLMLSLYGLDGDVLRETNERLEARFRMLEMDTSALKHVVYSSRAGTDA